MNWFGIGLCCGSVEKGSGYLRKGVGVLFFDRSGICWFFGCFECGNEVD